MVDAANLAEVLGPVAPAGAELAELVDGVRGRARPAVRLNRLGGCLSVAEMPFTVKKVPWYSGVYWVLDEFTPARHVLFGVAAYYVQDAGSLLAVALLAARPGELICDLCASPGGKATAILEQMGDEGALLVNETVRSRLAPLRLNLARQGGSRWVGTNLDPARLAELAPEKFDAVLVDAPCSGQAEAGGGKRGWRAFDSDVVRHNAGRQRRILAAAAELVRPGGRLVYSTCTFSWAENEQQVIDLCRTRGDMKPQPMAELERWRSPDASAAGCYRLYPHRHECAGAFAARLVREGQADDAPAGPVVRPLGRLGEGSGIDEAWGRWVRPVVEVEAGGVRYGWAEDVPAWLRELARFGPQAAVRKGRTWFPAYGLAMRRDGYFAPAATVEVSEEEARRFLRGESISSEVRGWAVAKYGGLALGWGKGNGRVLSNHLPRAGRLLV